MSRETARIAAGPTTRIPRRDVDVVKEASAKASTAKVVPTSLLASRVRSVIAVVAAGFLIFLIRDLLVGDLLLIGAHVVILILFTGTWIWLRNAEELGRRTLRMIELASVVVVAGFFAARHDALLVQSIEAGDRDTLAMASTFEGALFFSLTVAYGLLIPNRWQRALRVVIPLVLLPIALPLIMAERHDALCGLCAGYSSPLTVSGVAAFSVFGGVLAVYGSHHINSLRTEVHEATKIGQYELVRMLGEGGMGEVWEASHGLLARPAAIKLISRQAMESDVEGLDVTLRRFEREAKATAMLKSPHTVEVYDFGMTSDSQLYYVMEKLEGVDLESMVDRFGPLPPERVVHMLTGVCCSLAEAHEQGLTHRDIKPANIFCCRLGMTRDFVKVLDFGLVKTARLASDPEITSNQAMGTPAFIAPETMDGEEVDGRADIYALGCVAFWLLTGRYVFESNAPMEMAIAHARYDPPTVSDKAKQDIPEALEAVIMQCLEKDPADRPQTADDLARALAECGLAPWTQQSALNWWRLHLD